ncbi:hypothetical protein PTTG_30504, partial [Puccinia triticina 1-1 BBBD Race 1]
MASSPTILYDDEALFCQQFWPEPQFSYLRVRNFADGTSEEDIRAAFAKFGKIRHCSLLS